MRTRALKLIHIALVGLLFVTSTLLGHVSGQARSMSEEAAVFQSGLGVSIPHFQEQEPYYMEQLGNWQQAGAEPANEAIVIPANEVSGHSEGQELNIGAFAGRDSVLIWQNEKENWIEYKFQIEEAALYQMSISYYSYPHERDGNRSEIRAEAKIGIQINGHYPFREAKSLALYRKFHDDFPLKLNSLGEDMRPRAIQVYEWIEAKIHDISGAYATPLLWYMEEGIHTLRISTDDSVILERITLERPDDVLEYAQKKLQYPDTKPLNAEVITIEAEQVSHKNTVSVQVRSSKDAAMTPKTEGKRRFNSLGGTGWRTGGHEVAWEFMVDEPGLYTIALRKLQNFDPGHSVFRTILIDGEIPFVELENYRFAYQKNWEGKLLSNEEGEPFQFYLEKGKHSLTMRATYAPYQGLLMETENVIQYLNVVSQELFSLTGGNVDSQRTWRVAEQYPELLEQLKVIQDKLHQLEQIAIDVNGNKDNVSTMLGTSAEDIASLLQEPNEIPNNRDRISSIQSSVGNTRILITAVPLQLDTIYVIPSGAELPKMKANFWERAVQGIKNFYYSFIQTNLVSNDDDEVLQVWMKYGRDYVDLMQEMVDQYFTPQTGIQVRVNLLPSEQVLVLANSAGEQPDVALGLGEGQPVNYGLRDAAVALSDFNDFEQIASQFAPGALMPYVYDGNYYGLPITQSFQMLYYRKDILDKLSLDVPQTWQDVYDMLPTLGQHYYDFFIPQSIYTAMLYQYGADFYNESSTGAGLNTTEAYEAFRHYTDLYSIYGIPEQVSSFYQHFRDGDMPIGIADFNTYVELSVGAPELTGWWGMVPLPGVEQSDGEIVRWAGGNASALAQGLEGQTTTSEVGTGGQTSAMIFKKSDKQQEAWTFLQWLLSADTQQEFGATLESLYGVAFRWNTANLDAFIQLPWSSQELEPILEQWRWYRGIPNIPGSYFISREFQNAWNRTVLSGQNYRSSLQEAQRNIDREIKRKETEFGLLDENGRIIRQLEVPRIYEPWDGVNDYVEH